MSLLQIYSPRVRILLVIAFLAIFVFSFMRSFPNGSLVKTMWFIAFPIVMTLMVILIVRQTWKDFPEGAGATSERTISVHAPSESVIPEVKRAVEQCGWHLTEADPSKGHFKCKIGRNLRAFNGHIFTIDVKRLSDSESSINVRCETYRQIVDYGSNNMRIDQFNKALNALLH